MLQYGNGVYSGVIKITIFGLNRYRDIVLNNMFCVFKKMNKIQFYITEKSRDLEGSKCGSTYHDGWWLLNEGYNQK